MNDASFWLLRLVLPGRWGRWLTGLIIFSTLFASYLIFGGLLDGTGRTATGVMMFFCITLAYVVPIHHLITERSLAALNQLASAFDEDDAEPERWRRRVLRKSRRWNSITLMLGLLAGILHNTLLIDADELGTLFTSTQSLLPVISTVLIWLAMTCVISSLIDNALLFNRLATRVRIDLLNVRALTPFGSVAVSSTLAIIGAQAAFPAMMLETGVEYVTFVPGLIATGVPMIFLFVLPIWPLHRRILTAKRSSLAHIAEDIAALSAREGAGQIPYQDLQPMLVYRREVAAAPEWPFDTSAMGRLAIYLIIPPLTWVGAALIEIVIDTAI